MALLHSLEICGVRSFSPEDKQTVYFNTPVTLFLGQNGCGKTTIIESIRYALTSELPAGTDKGKGFLNDPQMSNKTTTKGSVKIKFLDSNGNMITVNRLLSVIPGKTKTGGLSFKKINPAVRMRLKDDPTNVQDISGRCIDIDSYCASCLNVSKCILNNVLFCHQENSSWPLEEGQKLKEKFDEIFDANKYKDCINNMRKYVKEKQALVKNIKIALEGKKQIMDEATAKMNRCNEKKNKLNEVKAKIEQKNTELAPLRERMDEILELEDTLGALQAELAGKEAEKKGLVEQQVTIKKHISYIFEGTDKELQTKINSFHSEQTAELDAITELEKKKNAITSETSTTSSIIQKKQIHIGQLKEEQKQYRNNVKEYEEQTEKLWSTLDLGELPESVDRRGKIKDGLQAALQASEATLNSKLEEMKTREKEVQRTIDEAREKYAATKQRISSQTSAKLEHENKLRHIKHKLNELDSSDSQLKLVVDKIGGLEDTLTKLKSSFNETEVLRQIEEFKETVESKDQALEKLDREYRLLHQNYATERKLESEEAAAVERQREVARIKSKHSHHLEKLFGDDVPDKNFKKSVLDIQAREESKHKSATTKIGRLEKQLTTEETTLKHLKKKLEQDQRELAMKRRKVSEQCKGKPFSDILKETYNKKEKLNKDKGQYSSAKIMYEAFINKFQKESPCCPVCHSDFADKKSTVSGIIKELRGKIERIPTQLIQVGQELKETEELYNCLQQLKPINDEIEALAATKIPQLEGEIGKLQERLDEQSMELAAEKHNLVGPQELLEACREFIADAALLDQYLSDIGRCNAVIEKLKGEMVRVPSKRTLHETEAEIDNVKAELSISKKRLESSKKNLDLHRDRCQKMNRDIQDAIQRQIEIQKLVQERPLLELQKTELNDKLIELIAEVEQLEEKFQAQERQLKSAIAELEEMVKANKKIQEKEGNKLACHKTTFQHILKLLAVVQRYEQQQNDNLLDKAVEDLAELKIKEARLDKDKQNVLDEISSKKEALAKKESHFRALKDNVTLREKQQLESKLAGIIADLKANIGGFNYRKVCEEKRTKQAEIDRKSNEVRFMVGQQDEIRQQIGELERDLEQPIYKHAHTNYKKKNYELVVNQMALDDMNQYMVVLEHSLLEFHRERMVHINRTIRELWRSIYRGNDIDYIEIKAEETTGGGEKRRMYNYKVVQVKNNVELEMRGRCSAGQKVLACLVIRMALAETFSAHCGILALDEPTTNLDRQNIVSLSDALSRIITDREREKNFQLLIISHDEEFLRSLSRVQSLDSYWLVQRDQGGFSKVEKKFL